MRELEEAKANRAAMKNKNGAKSKKGQTLKAKKKLILSIDNPVLSTNSANNEATICPGCKQSYDEDCIQCGLCKELLHEDCSSYEDTGAFDVTTVKFSGCVLLDSGPVYSSPPCQVRVRVCHFFPLHSLISIFFFR